MTDTTVLVAGAGPTGLAAALALNARNIPVTLIDPVITRSPFSKALAFNPRSQTLLSDCGVTEAIRTEAREISGLRFHNQGRLLIAIDFNTLISPPNTMLVLPQARTEALMEQALTQRGIAVQRGQTLVDAHQQDEQVVCTVQAQDGTTTRMTARYLIGADGAHSRVRSLTGQDFPGDALDREWLLADLQIDEACWRDARFDKANLFREANRFVFVLPVSPGLIRLVSDDLTLLGTLPEFVQQAQPGEVVWESRFRVSHRQVNHYRHGHIFLAGDAAHIHSPVGGRGMNMGIEDAFCLADCIATGKLDDYHRLRHAYGRRAIRMIRAQTRFATRHDPLTRFGIRMIAGPLSRLKLFQRAFAERNLGFR